MSLLSSETPLAGESLRLVQLIYQSKSTSGVTSALQMSDILAVARPRNARLGVTGVLTAVDGLFVQIIEGPETGIEALMGSLRRDPRHADLEVLDRRIVTTRAFEDWDMASPRLACLEVAQIAMLLSGGACDLETLTPVFRNAIARQDAVIEGRASPTSAIALYPLGDGPIVGGIGDTEA